MVFGLKVYNLNAMDTSPVMNVDRVNPRLYYKLDPGEPGLANSAPASMSILRVAGQELANYLAFKRQAEREGGFIIGGGIRLDLQKRGPFLAAVAGRTHVWIYTPANKQGRATPEESGIPQEQEDISKSEVSERIRALYRKLQQATDPQEREKLEREILLLQMALNALMAGLKIPEFLVGLLLDQVA
ncbi:MAG: hypothetical protein PWP09_1723 [Thermotogota bacterium]|nr:hypothetical protein [Thermotogota bacterium]